MSPFPQSPCLRELIHELVLTVSKPTSANQDSRAMSLMQHSLLGSGLTLSPLFLLLAPMS